MKESTAAKRPSRPTARSKSRVSNDYRSRAVSKDETQGAVTIDGPFSEAELDRAEAAWDSLKASGDLLYTHLDYVDVIQHPYFEEIAKKVLRAQAVHLWWGSAAARARPGGATLRRLRRAVGARLPRRYTGYLGGFHRYAATDARRAVVLAQRRAGRPRCHADSTRQPSTHYGTLESRANAGAQRSCRACTACSPPCIRRANCLSRIRAQPVGHPWVEQEPTPFTAKRGTDPNSM